MKHISETVIYEMEFRMQLVIRRIETWDGEVVEVLESGSEASSSLDDGTDNSKLPQFPGRTRSRRRGRSA